MSAAAPSIQDLKDLNIPEFVLAKKGRIVKLYDSVISSSPVIFKTPELYLPFNLSRVKMTWATYDNLSIDCQVYKEKNQPDFVSALEQLDNTIERLARENAYLFSAESIQGYYPFFRQNRDYPRLLKLNFPREVTGGLKTKFLDSTGKPFAVTETNIGQYLTRQSIIKTVIVNERLFYSKAGKLGSSWDILKLKLCDPPEENATTTAATEDSSEGSGSGEITESMSQILIED